MVLMFSIAVFAQKREIRKAERAVEDKDYNEAMSYLKEAEGLLSQADQEEKAQFYLVKSEAYQGSAGNDYEKMKSAIEAYKMAIELGGMDEFSERMMMLQGNLRVMLVNSAIEDQNAQRYDIASKKLYNSYKVSPKDTSDLYFAASNAVNGKNYDDALEYYKELVDLGYTGIEKQFIAVSKETGEEVVYNDKNQRDLMLKAGEVIKPQDRMTSSRMGEILRNMTLIYLDKNEEEKAKELMAKARAENPEDTSLMMAEARLAYKTGDKEKYNQLMEKVIGAEPNNKDLIFNMAVNTAEMGDSEKAKQYYERVLEIDPEYTPALINIAVLKLDSEKDLVQEMNNLGTSTADSKRYEELKQERKAIYQEVLPYLEKVNKIDDSNIEVKRTLMDIYGQLAMDDKFKQMKAEVEAAQN